MKVFVLFAPLALCLCLSAPAAADMLPPFTGGGLIRGLNPIPSFQSQGSSGTVITLDVNVVQAGVNFSPTVVDYVDSGCLPDPFNGGCSGSYSGKIDGGTVFYSVMTLDGSLFAMAGKINEIFGTVFGDYAIDSADEHSFTNFLTFSFTSSAWSRTNVNTVLLPWFTSFGSVDIVDTCLGPSCASVGGIAMTTTVVPEPSSLALLGGGVLVFIQTLRRKAVVTWLSPHQRRAVVLVFRRGLFSYLAPCGKIRTDSTIPRSLSAHSSCVRASRRVTSPALNFSVGHRHSPIRSMRSACACVNRTTTGCRLTTAASPLQAPLPSSSPDAPAAPSSSPPPLPLSAPLTERTAA